MTGETFFPHLVCLISKSWGLFYTSNIGMIQQDPVVHPVPRDFPWGITVLSTSFGYGMFKAQVQVPNIAAAFEIFDKPTSSVLANVKNN